MDTLPLGASLRKSGGTWIRSSLFLNGLFAIVYHFTVFVYYVLDYSLVVKRLSVFIYSANQLFNLAFAELVQNMRSLVLSLELYIL